MANHTDVLKDRHFTATRVRAQLGMLSAQFVLGMAVNLIGLPAEATGAPRVVTSVFTLLHVLIAIGLTVNAVLVAVRFRADQPDSARLAWIGLGLILATFVSGVLTLAFESNWWSYAMAIGFIASFWVYGTLYFRARK